MRGNKSQGELSEGSFSVSGSNHPTGKPDDPFSQGTTPNASFANVSFGTLNMMEHLKQHNEREDNDWKDLEVCIRQTTHSPSPQGAEGRGSPGQNFSAKNRGTSSSPGANPHILAVGGSVSPHPQLLGQQQQQQQSIPPQLSAEVKFFEYPQLPPDTAGRTVAPPEDSGCVKLFMGNMRFEMKRGTIAWAIKKACGPSVNMDPGRVLIHYKSSNGSQTPTGCASVFMDPEDAKQLLEFNQRIFCGASGVYASMTSEAMRTLLRDKRVLDMGPDGRVRGPKHAVVIEMSRATPNNSFANNGSMASVGGGGGYRPPMMAMGGSPQGGFVQPGSAGIRHPSSIIGQSPPPQQQQQQVVVQPLQSGSTSASPIQQQQSSTAPPPPPPTNHVAAALATANATSINGISGPVYHTYPGVGIEMAEPQPLVSPTEFFVGGICYEATPHFVAWMISLTGVKINSQNVTLFEDNKTGGKRGCAMVKVDGAVFPQIRAYHHRLLCDSRGVYVAESTQGIPTFIRQQKASGEVLRGPSHAVVIEKRRAQATPPPAYDGPPPPAYMGGGGGGGAPMSMPTTNWSMMPPVTAGVGHHQMMPPVGGMLGKGVHLPAFTAPPQQPFIPGPTTPPSMPLNFSPPRSDGPPSPTMLAQMNPGFGGIPRALGTPPSVSLADIPKPTWKNKGSAASTPRGGVSISSSSSACGGN